MMIINVTTKELFDELYADSAWTWEGMSIDDENLNAIANWFAENDAPLKDMTFYVTKGKDMNAFCGGLTGKKAYPKKLNILSIKLDNITNVNTLFIKKFAVGARWFDDIVDNNMN